MGTFTSFKAYASALDDLKVPPRVMREIGIKMAREATKIAEREASRDLGGDPEMSGWPKARLDTKVKKLTAGAMIQPARRVAAAGWTVTDQGRHAGGGVGLFQGPSIGLTTGGTRRKKDGTVATSRNRRSKKRWNGYTRGKGTADRAVAGFEKAAKVIAEREVRLFIRRGRISVD